MRALKPLFLILILLATVLQPVLAINDYGEDEAYLGQVVDDYLDESDVQAKVNVVHNATLDCMELNYTEGTIYEDLTLWTEIDPGNRIFFDNYSAIVCDFVRNVDNRLYKDFGASYFDTFSDYTLDLKFNETDWDNGGKIWVFFSDSSLNPYDQYLAKIQYLAVALTRYSGEFKIDVIEGKKDGGQNFLTSTTAFTGSIWYYGKLILNATTFSLEVYDDKELSSLIEEIYVILFEDKTNYRYALVSSQDSGHTNDGSANLKDFYYGEVGGGYSDGHYYTVEMLAGNRSLALLYNASIPGGTGVTMEFSDDNATWVNHNNASASDTLINGFESLDLRDLNFTALYTRVNMTSTGASSPRIYQFRLVTIVNYTMPGGNGEPPALLAMGKYYALAIILLILGVLIGMGMRGKR